MDHPAFISGHFDTNFVKEHYSPAAILAEREEVDHVGALAAAALFEQELRQLRIPATASAAWQNKRC